MEPVIKPKLIFKSFGLKGIKFQGDPVLPPADFYVDCRGLPDGLQAFASGSSPMLQKLMEQQGILTLDAMYALIEDGLQRIPTRRSETPTPYEKPYVVAFFCAHGIHRSRGAKEILARNFRASGFDVTIE